jgi:hypothetical protein
MSDYKDEVKNIVLNFIHNEGYEESQIEWKIKKLIEEKIENISFLNVYFVPGLNKVKVRVMLKINRIHDPIKYSEDFDIEIIINSKRKKRLKELLND